MNATIETKLNLNTVEAINKMWPIIKIPDTMQGNVDKSILQYTAEKLIKKQISKAAKKPRKEFTLSLYLFEIVTLERYLRNHLHYWPVESLEYSLITTYKNQLHQKT